MARFVPDVNTKRWVVITPRRARRPESSRVQKGDPSIVVQKNGLNFNQYCPFCFGNESLTPPEVYCWGKESPTDKNWLVRVVPNKYPITDIHEVIIHSPDHLKDIVDLDLTYVEILLKVYRERYNALSPKGSVIIFNNKGPKSGESLVHPHSQVVVIPSQITLDALTLEPVENIVHEDDLFVTFCPDFSQWPYEVWITPKKCLQDINKPSVKFGDITDEEISHLAKALQTILQKLTRKFADLSYNLYIYPLSPWYLRIIPRLVDRAGFELGTGLSVNIIDPLEVIKELENNTKE